MAQVGSRRCGQPGWWPARDEGKGGGDGIEVSFGLDLRPVLPRPRASSHFWCFYGSRHISEGLPSLAACRGMRTSPRLKALEAVRTDTAARLIPVGAGWPPHQTTTAEALMGPRDRQEPSPSVWGPPKTSVWPSVWARLPGAPAMSYPQSIM